MKGFWFNPILGKKYPRDNMAYKYPVSVKGIISLDNKIVLLKNERNEWELPGGKLELGETPTQCLAREILEELNLKVSVDKIIDAWVYSINKGINVLIVTYCCNIQSGKIVISDEHKEYGLFTPAEIQNLKMPDGYKNSIRTSLV